MGDDAGLANHRYAVAAADERQQRGEDAGVGVNPVEQTRAPMRRSWSETKNALRDRKKIG